MAYRRRHGITRSTTFKEEIHYPPSDDNESPSSLLDNKASATHRDLTFSSACGESAFAHIERNKDSLRSKSFAAYGDSARGDSKSGFWGVLARKAKAIIEDENENASEQASQTQFYHSNQSGETIPSKRNAFEEGQTMEGNNQESWKLQVHHPCGTDINTSLQQQIQQQNQTHHETQLKASRDVAMATAAKAKLLLRELKTVKADLAFAKLRCSQLEEENKLLREGGREKGGNAADDDLIRFQLEALLAEKARLAHENETYARENRFLREIVEYHQLTMQDVVYLDDEGMEEEETTQSNRLSSTTLSSTPSSPPLLHTKQKQNSTQDNIQNAES